MDRISDENLRPLDSSLNFFEGMKKKEMDNFFAKISSTIEIFPRNTRIDSHEKHGGYILYLLSGNVTASVTLPNGKWIPLRYIKAGEIFGLSSTSEGNENLSFVSASKATVKFIKKAEFLKLLESQPKLLANYLAFVNNRISFLLNKIVLFSIQNNRQRIAYYFLNETHKQKNSLIHIDLSKTCILECLGMSRASFYRELNILLEEKAIEVLHNKKYLCHWERLNNILSE
ncbi:MAG: Crp/Fnr family transcriptional regulator [Thermotaleaceae bacterium]